MPLALLVVLAGASCLQLASADTFLTFCTSDRGYAPYGTLQPTWCQTGDSWPSSLPAIEDLASTRAILKVPSWSWELSVGDSEGGLDNAGSAAVNSLNVTYKNNALPPQLINSAVAGYRYPAVIIVELKANKGGGCTPLSLWRFTNVLVTDVRRAYGDSAYQTWSLQLKYGGAIYYAPSASSYGWESTRACYSTLTGQACDKLAQ